MRAEGERVRADLWQKAFEHPAHLCNGLCPEEGYMDSRDPECFYCSVMTLAEAVREENLREPIAAYVRRLEPLATTDGLARYLAWRITAPQPPLARDPEWPPSECVCAETSTRNCPVHQNAGDPEWRVQDGC